MASSAPLTPTPPRRRFWPQRGRAPLSTTRFNSLKGRDAAPALDHLEELRWRLIATATVLVCAFSAAYWRREDLFTILSRPLDGAFRLQTLSVTGPFFTSVTVSAQAAFVVTIPVLIFHIYRFIAPAMEPEVRRGVRGIMIAIPFLFGAGVAFGYAFVLGPAIRFLLGIAPGSIDVAVRANEYFSFVTNTLIAMGAVFCFPLLLLGLGRVGLITASTLRTKRRIAILLAAVLAALLPTADPVSLAIELIPILALYELSIIAVSIQERMLKRREERQLRSEGAGAAR